MTGSPSATGGRTPTVEAVCPPGTTLVDKDGLCIEDLGIPEIGNRPLGVGRSREDFIER